jgi:hypothetical protein
MSVRRITKWLFEKYISQKMGPRIPGVKGSSENNETLRLRSGREFEDSNAIHETSSFRFVYNSSCPKMILQVISSTFSV